MSCMNCVTIGQFYLADKPPVDFGFEKAFDLGGKDGVFFFD